ncbi:MAG: HlyD family type I secretion periplasmic adaptor subunit [Pseudomonadota bacterium]
MTTKSNTLSPEALDFAPGLLAIQESPPAKLPRAVMYSVGTLFAIILLWAIFGKLDIIASAEGRLVPQTYVKIVQPSDAGIVEEILVKEGMRVKAGQVLMRMDTQLAKADEKTLKNELTLKSLQLRRIDAELTGRPILRQANDPSDLFSKVEAQHHDRRQSYLDAEAQQQQALRKVQHEHSSAKEILAKLREVTPILKEQADAYSDLGKQGYAGKLMVRDKQREYLEKSQDLRAQESTVASLQAAVDEARKQVSQISSKYRSDLQNERIEAEGQYRKLEQDLNKQTHKNDLLELKASQAGIVKDIATHTVGTVVSPGTVLLSLVPENEPLVAEIMVKNDDVGFVYPQQKVKLKLVAYPFEKYGMLEGEVIHVGPDASEPNNSTSGMKDQPKEEQQHSTYKALVSLKNQSLEAQGEKLKLVPGMQIIAEIHQGNRTVMEYLLSPVRKTLHDGGRER